MEKGESFGGNTLKKKIWNVYRIIFYFLPFAFYFASQKLCIYLDGREGANGWFYGAILMIFGWPILTGLIALFSPSKTKYDYNLIWVAPVSAVVLFLIPYLLEEGTLMLKLQNFGADYLNGYIYSTLFVLALVSWLCSHKKIRVFKKHLNV